MGTTADIKCIHGGKERDGGQIGGEAQRCRQQQQHEAGREDKRDAGPMMFVIELNLVAAVFLSRSNCLDMDPINIKR